MKRFHKHDCEDCTHLISVTQEETNYDLYYCPQGSRPTLIARYGEYGDYMSGLSFSHKGILKQAAELAIEKGLLSEQEWMKEIEPFIN